MLTVSVKALVEAIQDTEAYSLPEMNNGTEYLYKNLYSRLVHGDTVHLSDLDFDAFEAEDVGEMEGLYNNIFCAHNSQASRLRAEFRNMPAAIVRTQYV